MAEAVLTRDINSAISKNNKNIKNYIDNLYDIISVAKNIDHRRYLLTLCSGIEDASSVTKADVEAYLQATEPAVSPATINNTQVSYNVSTNAQNIYLALTSSNLNETLAAYKAAEPVNFSAIINALAVENKETKDGIIPMLSFHFTGEIKESTNFND